MSINSRYAMVLCLLLCGCGKRKPQPTADAASPANVAAVETVATEEFEARVMKVVDGDTIKVSDRDFKTLLIQFQGVDAPELAQDFGKEARQILDDRATGKVVRIVVDERDEMDRVTGEVFVGDVSLNVWIIRQGFGWYNHKYDTDRAKSAAEVEAREAGLGLWSCPTPIPPWVWKNPPDDGLLYVQGKGKSYHRACCQSLDGRRQLISLEEAVTHYKPCQRCNPPREAGE